MSKKPTVGHVHSILVEVAFEVKGPNGEPVSRIRRVEYKNPTRKAYDTSVEVLEALEPGEFTPDRA